MVSEGLARSLIAEAKGVVLTLMQENDNGTGFASPEWADAMYEAVYLLREADRALDRAALV